MNLGFWEGDKPDGAFVLSMAGVFADPEVGIMAAAAGAPVSSFRRFLRFIV